VVLVDQRQLLIDGERVRVGSRAFDILLRLIEESGGVVTKNELMAAVWPGVVVDDNNLAVHVSALRRLLGTGAIATVPGRGYQLRLTPRSGTPAPQQSEAVVSLVEPGKGTAPRPALLVGRQLDLSSIQELVARHALISLVGAAGIGKSTLAQRVMQENQGAFANGAVWCDLDSQVEPSAVCTRLARALNIEQTSEDLLGLLCNCARPLSVLVVLDGAERVIEEVGRVVSALLRAAPRMHFLITSQVPLRLAIEQVMRLQPLSIPASTARAQEAIEHGSVQLFVRRASLTAADFRLTDANVAEVVTICRRLDGIPLAIELAAARVGMLGVGAVARMLDHRFQLLRSFNRSTSVRHATLKAALDWSHGLLSPEERIVFRRTAVFQRSFSMQSLLAVACDAEVSESQAIESLQSLIDKSLVHVDLGVTTRYRLLESTRTLASEYLQSSGEIDDIARRHALSIAAVFCDAMSDMHRSRRPIDDIRSMLYPDVDNANAAMDWALRHDPPSACALMPGLSFACAEARFRDLQVMWDATGKHFGDHLPLRVRADWAMGCATFWSNRDIQAMDRWARQAGELFMALNDRDGMYCAQAALVLVAARRSEAIQEPLAKLHALQHSDLALSSLRYGAAASGVAASMKNDPDVALVQMNKAFELAQRGGDSLNMANARVNLLDFALSQGRIDDAIADGTLLIERLRSERRYLLLAVAELNLAAAYAIKGLSTQVTDLARTGWSLAIVEGLQAYWADYLALGCAKEARFTDAARFLGFGDVKYALYHTQRVGNELAAASLAERLIGERLAPAEFAAARLRGRQLGDSDIPQLIDAIHPGVTSRSA